MTRMPAAHGCKTLRRAGNAAVIALSALLISGCMDKGYRHCIYYGPAGYCIDKPHNHSTNEISK